MADINGTCKAVTLYQKIVCSNLVALPWLRRVFAGPLPRKHGFNHVEITKKMQPCTRIYYSNVLLIAQHVSSDKPLTIRS